MKWTAEDLEYPYGLNIDTQVEMLNLLEQAWITMSEGDADEQWDLANKIATFLFTVEEEEGEEE